MMNETLIIPLADIFDHCDTFQNVELWILAFDFYREILYPKFCNPFEFKSDYNVCSSLVAAMGS